MEFIIKTNEFVPKLSLLNKVINGKNAMPILDSIKFNVVVKDEKQYVVLTSSDGDMFLQVVCGCENADNSFDFCIDSKMLTPVITPLQGKDVKISLDESTHTIKGEYAKGHFKLPYTETSDYPDALNIDGTQEGEVKLSVEAQRLANAITFTKSFVASDILRPQMCGVHLDFSKDGLTSVATDGHMLVKYSDANVAIENDDVYSITIPEKPIGVIHSILSKAENNVTIIFNDKLLIIKNESFKATARLAEGRYPNYNSVIPTNSSIAIKVNRNELLDAIRHVAPLGSATNEIMSLEVDANVAKIKADDIDYSTSGEESLECEHTGDNIRIGFKSSNLQQIIQNISSEQIIIEMSEPSRAGVFKYDGVIGDGIEYISIAMPMLIS